MKFEFEFKNISTVHYRDLTCVNLASQISNNSTVRFSSFFGLTTEKHKGAACWSFRGPVEGMFSW